MATATLTDRSTSSSFLSSSQSPSGSADILQARALYDQAARSFLHRRHVESLLSAEKAIAVLISASSNSNDYLTESQLIERLQILRITVLATIYRPVTSVNKVLTELKTLRQIASETDTSIIDDCCILLSCHPPQFLTRLWFSTLSFFANVPLVPNLPHYPPPKDANSISPTPETLLLALQLPASVIASVVMGALRIDDESVESKSQGPNLVSRKEAKDQQRNSETGITAASPGISAARSICEWDLSSHSQRLSSLDTSLDQKALDQLSSQHSRILSLYALHILGSRLSQWEFASEVVRFAIVFRGDERERTEREELLRQLRAAQAHLETRGERRRAASEMARLKWEEERKRRAVSAEAQAAASVNEQSIQDALQKVKEEEEGKKKKKSLPETTRKELQRKSSTSSSTSTEGSEGETDPQIPRRKSLATDTERRKDSPDDSFAEKRDHISHYAERSRRRTNTDPTSTLSTSRPRPREGQQGREVTPDGGDVQTRLMYWVRSLRANPLLLVRYLSALVAVLFVLRRAFMPSRTTPPSSNSGGRLDAAAERTRTRLKERRREEQSLLGSIVSKVWDTLRMGTQVTYL